MRKRLAKKIVRAIIAGDGARYTRGQRLAAIRWAKREQWTLWAHVLPGAWEVEARAIVERLGLPWRGWLRETLRRSASFEELDAAWQRQGGDR